METCALASDYVCNCTDGFIGKNCTEVVSRITKCVHVHGQMLSNIYNSSLIYHIFFLSFLYGFTTILVGVGAILFYLAHYMYILHTQIISNEITRESDGVDNTATWSFYPSVLWNTVYGLFGYTNYTENKAPISPSKLPIWPTSANRTHLNDSTDVYVCSTTKTSCILYCVDLRWFVFHACIYLLPRLTKYIYSLNNRFTKYYSLPYNPFKFVFPGRNAQRRHLSHGHRHYRSSDRYRIAGHCWHRVDSLPDDGSQQTCHSRHLQSERARILQPTTRNGQRT